LTAICDVLARPVVPQRRGRHSDQYAMSEIDAKGRAWSPEERQVEYRTSIRPVPGPSIADIAVRAGAQWMEGDDT
jgi:hypothetical protein